MPKWICRPRVILALIEEQIVFFINAAHEKYDMNQTPHCWLYKVTCHRICFKRSKRREQQDQKTWKGFESSASEFESTIRAPHESEFHYVISHVNVSSLLRRHFVSPEHFKKISSQSLTCTRIIFVQFKHVLAKLRGQQPCGYWKSSKSRHFWLRRLAMG